MRSDDCSQHVLDDSPDVCTLVKFVWIRAHVMYASAWVAGHLGRATQTNAIFLQNGFSHFVTCSLPVTFSKGRRCLCVCPQQRTNPLQSWSVCRWDQCECLPFDSIKNTTAVIHAWGCFCDLTLSRLVFSVESPSNLKFKILNENTVEMTWTGPSSSIEGFRIQVISDAGE